MFENIKSKFNKNVLIQSIRLCIATTIAAIVGEIFDVGHMYWLMFTVVLVMQSEIGSSIKRSIQRFIGTLIGAPIGLILITLIGEYHIIALGITVIIMLTSMLFLLPKAYGIAAIFVSASVVVIYAMTGDVHTTQTALSRILDTFLGTILAIVVSLTVFPASLSVLIERDWANFLRQSGDSFEHITKRFVNQDAIGAQTARYRYLDSGNALIKEVSEYAWEPAYFWLKSAQKDDRQSIITNATGLLNKHIELGALINNNIILDNKIKDAILKISMQVKNSFYDVADAKVVDIDTLKQEFNNEFNTALSDIRQDANLQTRWLELVNISAFFEQTAGIIDILRDIAVGKS
jgi:uncharacterized membrane protein YgaE (UPF0421/DUF939 family)